MRFRASKTGLSPVPTPISSFPTVRSDAVLLLQFLLFCACLVTFLAFMLSLSHYENMSILEHFSSKN